jgi:hypothetical protein
MFKTFALLVSAVVSTAACFDVATAHSQNRSPYEVVWDSPSEDCHGSMPLGNGEVSVNAWIEPSGDLRFYVGRTDAWDDNGRLLKVGGLRVRVEGGSPERTKHFTQELTVKDATFAVRYGQGDEQVSLRLWVDAHRPVICVEVETPKPSTAALAAEIWRTSQETLPSVECSDIFQGRPEKTVVEPDTVLTALKGQIGWYHRNIKSVGPELCAKIQGMADFPRADPLLHRTFGALVATERPERSDDRTLRSQAGTRHVFEIYVHTRHPATAAEWQAEAADGLAKARAIPLAERRAAHERWWAEFWQRSWIHITRGEAAVSEKGTVPFSLGRKSGQSPDGALPENTLPVRIGTDQGGGSKFAGTLGRVGIYAAVLDDAQIERLAAKGPQDAAAEHPARLYSASPDGPTVLKELNRQRFAQGLTVEAWIKPDLRGGQGGMRIVDKITPGGSDGFLLDAYPGPGLRLITGSGTLNKHNVLADGKWQHVAGTVAPDGRMRIYLNGKLLVSGSGTGASVVADGDETFIVSRAYALQRFVTACAGRGNYPIKFNGSIFTVPAEGRPGNADFRAWGPGYWWQNTRLPYYAMCAAGDFDLTESLFRMYGRDLMPLMKFRTRHYFSHDGAYIPECIYFWGDVFTETYGWQPCDQRTDKLQASRWHKWEWVSGLELVCLMLDYYDHTGDAVFLQKTALPTAHEILTFFDQHYKLDDKGKLVMRPSQALETWWECLNPMPEVAGLHAATTRLLALPETVTSPPQRAFWKQLQAKLPALPTTQVKDGKTMLAPAEVFAMKRNIENPELYAVFPFRRFAFDKPHAEWAIEALNRRLDRGALGWRQDDLFMAYLGQTDQARDYVVRRARTKHAGSRFPVFWGPNYDWIPDQDHGSVLMTAVQSLLMQTEGRTIHLLPAWPQDWNAEFKLHAPLRTIVSGRVEAGRLILLDVQPADRRADVVVRQHLHSGTKPSR